MRNYIKSSERDQKEKMIPQSMNNILLLLLNSQSPLFITKNGLLLSNFQSNMLACLIGKFLQNEMTWINTIVAVVSMHNILTGSEILTTNIENIYFKTLESIVIQNNIK